MEQHLAWGMILRLACLPSPKWLALKAAFLAWAPCDMDPNRLHEWKHTTAAMADVLAVASSATEPDGHQPLLMPRRARRRCGLHGGHCANTCSLSIVSIWCR